MNAQIRPAVASDAETLTACIEAAYAAIRERGVRLPPVSEGVAEDIRDNHVWVVEDSGQIVGGLIILLAPDAVKLANVAVDPKWSGLGIGRALLKQAAQFAQENDRPEIHLTTHADTPENVRLYQYFGYEVSGRDGDKIFMTLRLSD